MLVEFRECSRAVTLLATRQLSLLSHSRSISHAPRQIDKALSSQTTSLSRFRSDRSNDRFQHTSKALPVFNHPRLHTNPNFLKNLHSTSTGQLRQHEDTHDKSLSSASTAQSDSLPPKTPVKMERENILTIPNLLCLSRIAMSPYIAYLIVQTGNYPWALAAFGYAGITDLLDGWIARNFRGQASTFGSFLDPLSDKILMTTMYLSLTYVGMIPEWLTSLVVSRDLFLVYAGLYVRYMSVEQPVTLKKYLDFSIPTAQVNPTMISKVNTSIQMGLVVVALCAPIFDFLNHPAYLAICGVTASTTFASAVSYAFTKKVYTLKNKADDEQFGKRLTAFILFICFNVGFIYLMPKTEHKPSTLKLTQNMDT